MVVRVVVVNPHWLVVPAVSHDYAVEFGQVYVLGRVHPHRGQSRFPSFRALAQFRYFLVLVPVLVVRLG